MLISIIIPAFNEAIFIGGLLDDINKRIDQEIEIIVVDNGSTDNTGAIAAERGAKVVSLPNKVFPSTARNTGVKASSGSLLVFFDADILLGDEWVNNLDRLLVGEKVLEGDYLTGAPYDVSKSPSWLEKYWFKPLSEKPKTYINGGNIITTRKAFDILGGFSPDLETGEDVEFCQRALSRGIVLDIDRRWHVYHEGFPKDLSGFVKREAWHGRGDLGDLKAFLSSKVAIASLLFILFHLVAFISFIFTGSLWNLWVLTCALLTIGLSASRAYLDIKTVGFGLLVATFISYMYFFGRSRSLLDITYSKFLRILRPMA